MHRDVMKCWILAAQFINMQSAQANTSTKQTRTSQQNRDHLKVIIMNVVRIYVYVKRMNVALDICRSKNKNLPQMMIS